MDPKELADVRRNYSKSELSESGVSADPFEQFSTWMENTLSSGILEPNAMVLSTADAECRPSSRVVLLKGFDQSGFVFFTNYESRKGRELAANPHAAILFFWPELERQINISGTVDRVSREGSETYFRSRPFDSRIGAWASKQSSKIESRTELEKRFASLKNSYSDGEVPLPPFWGGFRLSPDRFEFWQGRSSRLHDRICYKLRGGRWEISRLSP
ncbi:MAG: pyridoxamine 5'-phosphate oxidase [Pyrinomonadaceae bacterium]